jgi:hypothetical protein
MIPKPRRRVERVPALGPMRPEQMPRRLVKPADEPPTAGLWRFVKRHFDRPPVRKPAP